MPSLTCQHVQCCDILVCLVRQDCIYLDLVLSVYYAGLLYSDSLGLYIANSKLSQALEKALVFSAENHNCCYSGIWSHCDGDRYCDGYCAGK